MAVLCLPRSARMLDLPGAGQSADQFQRLRLRGWTQPPE
jgi:hypothetical protein